MLFPLIGHISSVTLMSVTRLRYAFQVEMRCLDVLFTLLFPSPGHAGYSEDYRLDECAVCVLKNGVGVGGQIRSVSQTVRGPRRLVRDQMATHHPCVLLREWQGPARSTVGTPRLTITIIIF